MIVDSKNSLFSADFQAGVTLLVDKPLHWTSFDVVNKIRFALRKRLDVKKIRVGHAGTLDPLATGLLIIAIGRDTKRIDEYQGLSKCYSGTMRLGATTPSYDAEFEPDALYDTGHITPSLLEKTRQQFIGKIEQFPPAYSAVKIEGKRAYQLARKGETPELRSREVEIYDFTLENTDFPLLSFDVHCSKGTYIRSLVYDFGKALSSGAYLTRLRRTAIGDYRVENAFSIEDVVSGH
jgi:tRNA pseudouridine55 synthase